MGKKSTRTLLKEANQATRDAANEAHRLGVKVAYQEHLIEVLRGDAIALRDMRASARERISDVELYALAAVVHTHGTLGTPERKILIEQLKLRGVIATPSAANVVLPDAASTDALVNLPVANRP